jgi:hypothetical protein
MMSIKELDERPSETDQTVLVQDVISMSEYALYNGTFDVLDYVWFVIPIETFLSVNNNVPTIAAFGCYWAGTRSE